MSGPVPPGLDEPLRRLLQQLTESCGFPNDFRLRKLSDTQACLQMKVGNVWLTGPTWTFS
jgi:hypothetical protein